jgi:hypothetical protein
MRRFDLDFPCPADFGSMRRASGGRFCDACEKVVRDLSEAGEAEAEALLARAPGERVCVRYVYDARTGEIVFGTRAAERPKLVPEHRLLARLKSRVAMAAAIAAPLLVEACGGNDGNYRDRSGDPSQQSEELEAADGAAELMEESFGDGGADPELDEENAESVGADAVDAEVR